VALKQVGNKKMLCSVMLYLAELWQSNLISANCITYVILNTDVFHNIFIFKLLLWRVLASVLGHLQGACGFLSMQLICQLILQQFIYRIKIIIQIKILKFL
jgi:hypothetical protein